jgi:hypothetical protein
MISNISNLPVKMIASLNNNIFVPLLGKNTEPVNVYNQLKNAGARISLEHVKSLMEGKESEFKDFRIMSLIPNTEKAADIKPTKMLRKASVEKANLVSPAPAVSRGRGREYLPQGEIRPLKHNTTYARLMEMCLKGATMKELLAATANTTAGGVNDVLYWQIKHRGYGLRFDSQTGKYHLLLPKGHTALMYKD